MTINTIPKKKRKHAIINYIIVVVLIIILMIFAGCQKQQIEFTKTPPKYIQEKFNLADQHILNANSLVEQAFVNENNVMKLTADSIIENWKKAKQELDQAIDKYQKSLEENNEAINILQEILKTDDPSINKQEMLKTIEFRKLNDEIRKKSIECHIITKSAIDSFLVKDQAHMQSLSYKVEKCENERTNLEQKYSEIKM